MHILRRDLLRQRRQQRNNNDKRYDQGAPIDPPFVLVYTIGVIQRGYIVPALLNNPIVTDQHPGNRRHENRIRAHEIEKRRRRRDDNPGTQRPAAQERNQHHAAPDVEPARRQRRHVVRKGDPIRADVHGDLGQQPYTSGEERGGAAPGRTLPSPDDVEGGPVHGTVDLLRGAGGHDAEDTDEDFEQGDEGELPELRAAGFAEAGEVGDIDGEGGVAARYAGLLGSLVGG